MTKWVTNDYFLKGILVSLQNQIDPETGLVVAVDSSACLDTFTSFRADSAGMSLGDMVAAKQAYEDARKQKGQMGASNAGFWINFMGTYQQLITSGFNFYNECSLNYYMVAIGSGTQNPSGFANLAVAFGFRLFKGEDETLPALATAAANYILVEDEANATAAGDATGTFIRNILQVEIPTTTNDEMAYYQPASSFQRR